MKNPKIDYKMLFLKQLINQVTPRLLRLSRGVQPETPQSKLILRVWKRLEDVLKKEVQTGCFGDNNFQRLLTTLRDALLFFCERDRYYKRWLGLFAFFLAEEFENMKESFSYQDAIDMNARPMMLSLKEFERHRGALFQLNMTGYLYGLSITPKNFEEDMKRARENLDFIDFPCKDDPNAVIRMYFQNRTDNCFRMLFLERVVHG